MDSMGHTWRVCLTLRRTREGTHIYPRLRVTDYAPRRKATLNWGRDRLSPGMDVDRRRMLEVRLCLGARPARVEFDESLFQCKTLLTSK